MSQVRIIAEAGVNHNGDVEQALRLVDVAVDAGADVVKFQTFKAERIVSRTAPKAEYQKRTTDATASQFEMLKALELTPHAHERIKAHCKKRGIDFLSTPFDLESLSYLTRELQVSELKIASGDLTNAPMLLEAARSKLPVIVSTGMSSLGEIEAALCVLAFGYLDVSDEQPSITKFRSAFGTAEGQRRLHEKVTIMHCASEYPAPFGELNLSVVQTLRQAFALRVGYSDHSLGLTAPIAAVALGATTIEKHFTLDRSLAGPDHAASLEPADLKHMVRTIRETEASLGVGLKFPTISEWKNKAVMQKSLVAATPIRKGEAFTPGNLTTKRPAGGLAPIDYWDVLGRVAVRDFAADELVHL